MSAWIISRGLQFLTNPPTVLVNSLGRSRWVGRLDSLLVTEAGVCPALLPHTDPDPQSILATTKSILYTLPRVQDLIREQEMVINWHLQSVQHNIVTWVFALLICRNSRETHTCTLAAAISWSGQFALHFCLLHLCVCVFSLVCATVSTPLWPLSWLLSWLSLCTLGDVWS